MKVSYSLFCLLFRCFPMLLFTVLSLCHQSPACFTLLCLLLSCCLCREYCSFTCCLNRWYFSCTWRCSSSQITDSRAAGR